MTDPEMIRSEEELTIGAEPREAGRARLVKFTETEVKSFTVAVRREQVRIEYGPPAAGPARSGQDPRARGERWLVLYDEEIVVQRRWVARERVRLAVHAVTDDHEVSVDRHREGFEIDTTTGG